MTSKRKNLSIKIVGPILPDDDPDDIIPLTTLMGRLRDAGHEIIGDSNDYTTADDKLMTAEPLTDQAIIDTVRGPKPGEAEIESDDDDNIPVPEAPTHTEALTRSRLFCTLHVVFNNESENTMKAINFVFSILRQTYPINAHLWYPWNEHSNTNSVISNFLYIEVITQVTWTSDISGMLIIGPNSNDS